LKDGGGTPQISAKKNSQQTYINHLSSLFTQILQTAGREILKSPSKIIPDPDRPSDKPEKPYSTTPDTPETSELKKLISTACSQLKQALKTNAPFAQLDALYKNNSKAIHNLKKHLLSQQQDLLHQYASTGLLTLSLTGPNINEAWTCLGKISGEKGKLQKPLPALIFTNASPDKSIWTQSETVSHSTTDSAEAWGDYRYALGHHRRHHPSSPYNEIEADSIELELRTLDTLSQPLNLDSGNTPDQEEIIKHLKRAPPHKSPGPDGITNRMMKAGGPRFQLTLTFFQQVWLTETYPSDWHDMLIQPIYKGGGKAKADPTSYTGICLSPHVTKLFEGLLGHRLTLHTEQNDTLTLY
jgi:hypothetical protein